MNLAMSLKDRIQDDMKAAMRAKDKQRRESLAQYQNAGREDLAAQESFEIEIIQAYLPTPLSEADLDALIANAIAVTGAQSVRDMGKVMALIKDQAQGRADMVMVSARVKAHFGG
jgi:hypothetical protein